MYFPIHSGCLRFWRVGSWWFRDSGAFVSFRFGHGCIDIESAEPLCQDSDQLVVAVPCFCANVVLHLVSRVRTCLRQINISANSGKGPPFPVTLPTPRDMRVRISSRRSGCA